ncbi:uncharacterized protein PODANS_6_8290 [Podospora anserina S mat+]|uniref:Podospora anserina S mat+ genomic DNA chromosome 6, supercontig 4 n=1 Tax=Podospora anserina (strain S / ATCC MYA-4624 / DSM 980 / FGSC 10383) TaxID=515849 RepID=B2AMX4_PODAN|nr:uncharacterized protein PODANS_6_8290 [Podospora anserina S mat+]CAP65315.1 unnamed protein product [Podospora anserina S mat+]
MSLWLTNPTPTPKGNTCSSNSPTRPNSPSRITCNNNNNTLSNKSTNPFNPTPKPNPNPRLETPPAPTSKCPILPPPTRPPLPRLHHPPHRRQILRPHPRLRESSSAPPSNQQNCKKGQTNQPADKPCCLAPIRAGNSTLTACPLQRHPLTPAATKTGCPMRMKAVQEKAHPYDDKWHVVVQCAEHNHEPFTGEPGVSVPAQFRKIEPDGARWLMIMHREAHFGEKYQYVKKSDVRNMLAKMKREEERKAAQLAAQQGLPSNVPYTIIPQQHQPPPPPPVSVQQMPALPEGMHVPDPDLESDDDEVENL